jgi:hypothetical protein
LIFPWLIFNLYHKIYLFYQLREAEQKIEDMNREQESIIDVFSEERDRRNAEEKNLRMKLQV